MADESRFALWGGERGAMQAGAAAAVGRSGRSGVPRSVISARRAEVCLRIVVGLQGLNDLCTLQRKVGVCARRAGRQRPGWRSAGGAQTVPCDSCEPGRD